MKTAACRQCGRTHRGLPTDWGFDLPDVVFDLTPVQRYRRVRSTPDLCALDDARFFLRGVLLLPLAGRRGDFGWGVWAEVGRADHDTYVGLFERDEDGSSVPRFGGRLANALPGYRATSGAAVGVQLGGPADRPTLWLSLRSRHALAREQREGLSPERHHEVLEACGYVARPSRKTSPG